MEYMQLVGALPENISYIAQQTVVPTNQGGRRSEEETGNGGWGGWVFEIY